MYCPYCKEELKIKNGELYCKVGDSYFSKHIEKVFDKKIDNSKKAKLHIPNVENSEVFKKEDTVLWKCSNCGYIFEGAEAPKVCPACLHAQSYFELFVEAY